MVLRKTAVGILEVAFEFPLLQQQWAAQQQQACLPHTWPPCTVHGSLTCRHVGCDAALQQRGAWIGCNQVKAVHAAREHAVGGGREGKRVQG